MAAARCSTMDEGLQRLGVVPLLHFHGNVKITAMDVHPHDQLCALATSDGAIYTATARILAELGRDATADKDEHHVPGGAPAARPLHGLERVVGLAQPTTQLVWAPWRNTRTLGAIVAGKAVRLFTLGGDGAWRESELPDVPDSSSVAFSPARHDFACACSGGRVVVLRRANDVWTTRWTEAPEPGVRGTARREVLCVSWSDSGLLAIGDNEGSVRVLSLGSRGTQLVVSINLWAPAQHVAFAPSMARSFTLLAAGSHDTIHIVAFAMPTDDASATTATAGAASLGPPEQHAPLHALQRRTRTSEAPPHHNHHQQQHHMQHHHAGGASPSPGGSAPVLGMKHMKLSELEMTSRLRWNSLGNTLCCSLVDGAVQMYRLKIAYRSRAPTAASEAPANSASGAALSGGTGALPELLLELEENGTAFAPFHYNQLIEL